MFSVSITHHSKIRELSDGNNNWKQKSNGLLSYGSHHFWVMNYGNRVMSYENNKSKQPLIFLILKEWTLHFQISLSGLSQKIILRIYRYLEMSFYGENS